MLCHLRTTSPSSSNTTPEVAMDRTFPDKKNDQGQWRQCMLRMATPDNPTRSHNRWITNKHAPRAASDAMHYAHNRPRHRRCVCQLPHEGRLSEQLPAQHHSQNARTLWTSQDKFNRQLQVWSERWRVESVRGVVADVRNISANAVSQQLFAIIVLS